MKTTMLMLTLQQASRWNDTRVCADGVDYGVQPANHTALVPPTRTHTHKPYTPARTWLAASVCTCVRMRECTYYKPHCNRAALAPLACRSPPTPTPTNSPAIYSSHPAAQSSIQPAIVPFMPFLERQPANQPTDQAPERQVARCVSSSRRPPSHAPPPALLPSCPRDPPWWRLFSRGRISYSSLEGLR